MILILMGVSGAGKTTIGKALAEKLSYQFHDADDFHPTENKQKMTAGIGLTDEDRLPWLDALREEIQRWNDGKIDSVLACSALKQSYRMRLISGITQNNEIFKDETCNKEEACNNENSNSEIAANYKMNVIYVYLNGPLEFISDRMSKRVGHFMPLTLLKSQFQDLEEPQEPEIFINIDIQRSISETVDEIIEKIFPGNQ